MVLLLKIFPLITSLLVFYPTECFHENFLKDITNDLIFLRSFQEILDKLFEANQTFTICQLGFFPFPPIRNPFVKFNTFKNLTNSNLNFIFLENSKIQLEIEKAGEEKFFKRDSNYVFFTKNLIESGRLFGKSFGFKVGI